MNPAGAILTYMDLRKVKKYWFNIPLLIGQLMFIIAGTAYGKIKWFETLDSRQHRSFLIMLSGLLLLIEFNISMYRLPYHWWSLAGAVFVGTVGILEYRCIRWGRVWRAAQVSHVRLCLREWSAYHPDRSYVWEYINFGIDGAEIQLWRMDMIDGKRFRYFDPTFEPSPEFIAAMIEYAEAQVGKEYDDLQLISSGLHLIAWIIYPPCWGKELKVIKAFNRPGGREHCISGFTACLRWGEYIATWRNTGTTQYFPSYSTATTFPCLVPLSKNWEMPE